jgi:hypothetical protein
MASTVMTMKYRVGRTGEALGRSMAMLSDAYVLERKEMFWTMSAGI